MRQVKAGSEDVTTYVVLVDEVDGSPKTGIVYGAVTCQYTLGGAASATQQSAVTQTTSGAHSDYGFVEMNATYSPGLYRVDWPNTAFASGDQVSLAVTGSGFHPAIETVQLVAADGSDLAAVLEDTIDIQSRIPAALVGGRIDASAGAISADVTAADNLEAMLDGTGGVTLSLGQLAIVASSNDTAIIATGSGTGHGIISTGGSSGGCGAAFLGDDGADPGSISYGMCIHSGAINGGGLSLLGEGIIDPAIKAIANRADGVQFTSGGSGGSGLKVTGEGGGDGIEVVAGATGAGISVAGGATSGDAIKASATDGHGMYLAGGTNNEGFEAAGNGTAAGMALKGGSTGDGLYATSGWNAGEGIYAYGQAVSSNGLKAESGGAGKDINADEIDDILEDTGTTLPATLATIDGEVGDILEDTGTTLPATLATIDGEVGDILQDTTSLVADHGDNTLLLQTTIDNYASVTDFTIADGSTHDDLYVGCMIIIRDNGTATNKAVGLISDYDGSTKNVTLATNPPGSSNWTMGNGDHVVIVAAPNQLTPTAASQISTSVWTASVHPGSTGTGLKLNDIHSALPVLPTKNRALAKFPFLLVSDIDHVSPKTGAVITATKSIDGGAFAACANAGSGLAEVGNGVYTIDLAASDTNGSNIVLRFTATGADDRVIVFVTQPSAA